MQVKKLCMNDTIKVIITLGRGNKTYFMTELYV